MTHNTARHPTATSWIPDFDPSVFKDDGRPPDSYFWSNLPMPTKSLAGLGDTQRRVLEALIEHGRWTDDYTSGWTWNGQYGTRRILDSLVKRGLVIRRTSTRDFPHRDVIEYVPKTDE